MTQLNDESQRRTAEMEEKGSDRRSQRIADYLTAALESRCPLVANVGAANSDLMRVRCFVQESLDNAMTEVTPSLSGLAFVTPGIDAVLKVDKQIDRYTQLALQLTRADRQAADLGQKRSGTTDEIVPPE